MGEDEANTEDAAARPRRRRLWRALRWAVAALAVFLLAPYLLVLVYTAVNPPVTTLMIVRLLSGHGIDREWVALDDIAKTLPATVIMTEDGRFCEHSGVDWMEVEKVIDAVGIGEGARGASTIPMQTAKNLFLWPWRSYVRKALEVPLAYWIDTVWSKRRIMEVYLNTVEWGPGIYGAQAAAQAHFGKDAGALTQGESALLAAALPNPLGREAGNPGRTTRALADRAARLGRQAGSYIGCLSATADNNTQR